MPLSSSPHIWRPQKPMDRDALAAFMLTAGPQGDASSRTDNGR
ncbi:hypothetical protein ACW5WQ_00875 [Aeromonas rivuli]|nr:hypothetical protein [Aeromonas rivuli]